MVVVVAVAASVVVAVVVAVEFVVPFSRRSPRHVARAPGQWKEKGTYRDLKRTKNGKVTSRHLRIEMCHAVVSDFLNQATVDV